MSELIISEDYRRQKDRNKIEIRAKRKEWLARKIEREGGMERVNNEGQREGGMRSGRE